jgi:hypothetical protein
VLRKQFILMSQASRLKAVAIVQQRFLNSRATRGRFLWRPFRAFRMRVLVKRSVFLLPVSILVLTASQLAKALGLTFSMSLLAHCLAAWAR